MAELTGTPIETKRKVWIELESKGLFTDEQRHEITVRGNVMLRKLGYNQSVVFWWNERKKCYCLTMNETEEFLELPDNGHWFDLNFIAKQPGE